MTDKQILFKFIRFFMSRNTTPGLPQGRSDLYKFDEKICGGVPSALELSAPAAPQLSGPPSHKNPATPLRACTFKKIFRGYTPTPFYSGWTVEGMRRVTVERGGLGREKNV
jgi:hypothetical protein